MKGFTNILLCSLATYVSVAALALPAKGDKEKNDEKEEKPDPETAAAAGGEVSRGKETIVLFEVGGIPGNECLTFRNNGEVVNAACVNEAADRQVTPSKKGGVDVLLVQRGFTDGFRPDLVGVQACLGLTGSLFRAVDCNGEDELASLVDGELKTPSGACQSGHNDKAQLTVDKSGEKCAKLRTTKVQATKPE